MLHAFVVSVLGFAQTPAASEVADRYLDVLLAANEALEASDLARAKQLFDRALELRPANSTCAYHLACVAARKHETSASLEWLGKAIDWGFDDLLLAKSDASFGDVAKDAAFAKLLLRIATDPRRAPPRQVDDPAEPRVVWNFGNGWPQFTPDGERISFGGVNDVLLDVASNEPINVFPRGANRMEAPSQSPDGRFIVTLCRDLNAQIWSGVDGSLLHALSVPTSQSGEISWSAHTPLFAINSPDIYGTTEIWNAETGAHAAPLAYAKQGAWLSPDGTRVMTFGADGGAPSIRFRDLATREVIAEDADMGTDIFAAGFTPDGRFAYAATTHKPNHVRVYDGRTGAKLREFGNANEDFVRVEAIDANRSIATIRITGERSEWSLETGKRLGSIELGTQSYSTHRTSPDGRFVCSVIWDDATRMRDAKSGQQLWNDASTDHRSWSESIAYSPDSESIALPVLGKLELRDVRSGAIRGELGDRTLRLSYPSFAPSGEELAIGTSEGDVLVLDVARAQIARRWHAHGSPVTLVRWSRDGARIGTIDELGDVDVWRASTGEQLWKLSLVPKSRIAFDDAVRSYATFGADFVGSIGECEHGSKLVDIAARVEGCDDARWSRDGKWLALCGKHAIALVDASTGKAVDHEFKVDVDIDAVDISPDDRWLAAGTDGGLRIWRTDDGTLAHEWHRADVFDEDLDVTNLRFMPDGKHLIFATGQHWTLNSLGVESGNEIWSHDASCGDSDSMDLAIDERGERIYTWRYAQAYDARTGRVLNEFANVGWYGPMFPSPDGSRVVRCYSDSLWIYDTHSWKRLYTFVPLEQGDWLAVTRESWCNGTARALHSSWLTRELGAWPVDCFATELVDPVRVRAAARGLDLAPPKLGTPPSVRWLETRAPKAAPDSRVVAFEIGDARGIAEVELRVDGSVLATDATRAIVAAGALAEPKRFEFALAKPAGASEVRLDLRLRSLSGLESRPMLLRIHFDR